MRIGSILTLHSLLSLVVIEKIGWELDLTSYSRRDYNLYSPVPILSSLCKLDCQGREQVD
jgi:hypothetical protein